MDKQANMQKAISLMKSKGMSAEQALKTVYPDWDEAQIKKAAMTIRTVDKTASVMQIGSAMVDLDKTASAEKKKLTFSPAMDKSPLLKGKQSKLPDQIQAKILKGKTKKKLGGVSLTALQYASNAIYAAHVEKTAGKIKQANPIMKMLGMPSVSQYAARGAGIGGVAGGLGEIGRMLHLTTDAGRTAHAARLANLNKATTAGGDKGIKRLLPFQKADPSKGQVAFSNQATKDAEFLKRFDELKGMGGFAKNPTEYIKLFAPQVLGSAAAGTAAGGALGAGAGAVAKNMAKRKMIDTAKKVGVPAAIGLGGLAVATS